MKSLLFIIIFLSLGCKGNKASTTKENVEESTFAAQDAKTFLIGTLKISATQSAYKTPGAPKPRVLQSCIRKKLKESTYFTEDTGKKVNIYITYDLLKEKSQSVVLLAEIEEGGKRIISAGTRIQSQGEGFQKLGEKACEDLVIRLTNQVEVATSSDAELKALLSDSDSSAAILKNVVQNIREKNITSASPQLAALLDHEDRAVAVAAAAGLAKFQYTQARSGLLTLAEKLSRDKNPTYLPMIYILADIGGAEINEYLKIVSTSHELPRVREVAKKAIEKAKEKKKPKE